MDGTNHFLNGHIEIYEIIIKKTTTIPLCPRRLGQRKICPRAERNVILLERLHWVVYKSTFNSMYEITIDICDFAYCACTVLNHARPTVRDCKSQTIVTYRLWLSVSKYLNQFRIIICQTKIEF